MESRWHSLGDRWAGVGIGGTGAADRRGKIDIYDTDSWEPVVTLEDQFFGFTKSADWSPEGRRLAMSGRRWKSQGLGDSDNT